MFSLMHNKPGYAGFLHENNTRPVIADAIGTFLVNESQSLGVEAWPLGRSGDAYLG